LKARKKSKRMKARMTVHAAFHWTEGKKKQHAGQKLLGLIESHKYYRQLTRSQHISSITTMAPQMEKNGMYAK
jgi:hypothetical protein